MDHEHPQFLASPIFPVTDLKRALAKTTAGDRVKIEVIRDGKTQTLTVTLGGGL